MLKQETRNQLRVVLGDEAAATEVADAIDGGGGLLSKLTIEKLERAFGKPRGDRFAEAFTNGLPIANEDVRSLSAVLASWKAAEDIIKALASN